MAGKSHDLWSFNCGKSLIIIPSPYEKHHLYQRNQIPLGPSNIISVVFFEGWDIHGYPLKSKGGFFVGSLVLLVESVFFLAKPR